MSYLFELSLSESPGALLNNISANMHGTQKNKKIMNPRINAIITAVLSLTIDFGGANYTLSFITMLMLKSFSKSVFLHNSKFYGTIRIDFAPIRVKLT